MYATTRQPATPAMPSSAALLISLSHSLDAPTGPLGRRARRLAARLARHPADRSLQRRVADLTAALLSEADAGLALEADGLLDGSFDD